MKISTQVDELADSTVNVATLVAESRFRQVDPALAREFAHQVITKARKLDWAASGEDELVLEATKRLARVMSLVAEVIEHRRREVSAKAAALEVAAPSAPRPLSDFPTYHPFPTDDELRGQEAELRRRLDVEAQVVPEPEPRWVYVEQEAPRQERRRR